MKIYRHSKTLQSVLMDQLSHRQLAFLPGVFQTCSLRAVLSESLTLIWLNSAFSKIYLSHFVQYYTLKHKPATWRHEIFTHTHKHEQAHSILCKLRPSVPAGNEHVKEGTQWRALWGMTAPFKTSWLVMTL